MGVSAEINQAFAQVTNHSVMWVDGESSFSCALVVPCVLDYFSHPREPYSLRRSTLRFLAHSSRDGGGEIWKCVELSYHPLQA